MKAAWLKGLRKFQIVKVDVPRIQPDQVLVKVEKAAICGSDRGMWKGEHFFNELYSWGDFTPGEHGHEASGRVVEVGPNVEGVQVGDLVCRLNLIGSHDLEMKCFSEFVVADAPLVVNGADPEVVCFADPVTVALNHVHHAGVAPGDNVLVTGQGFIGLLVTQLFRRQHINVINGALTTGLVNGAVDPITGRVLDSTWVSRNQSQQDDPATQKSAVVAGQARYFNDRLIIGAGWRYDKLEILDRTAQRDPVTNEWSRSFATEETVHAQAHNSSLGVVFHVTDDVSVHYNKANNQGLQGSSRIININDLNGPSLPAPNSEGRGEDIGATLKLFDGKINLRAVHFTTDGVNLNEAFSPTGVGADKVSANIMGALQTAGLVTQQVADARTVTTNGVVYGQASKGYEVNLTANLTKSWRLLVSYSYTDTRFSNYGVELAAWMDHEIAYWNSFNQGGLVAGDGRTIDEVISFMVAGFGNQANVANIGEPGLRKHKVTLFTRFDLPGDRLEGAYIGGGYRYLAKNLAGTNEVNTVGYFVPSYWRADMLVGYKFQKSGGKRLGGLLEGLRLQLNVTNVFDKTDPLITRIQPDGVSITRAVVQEPRMWRLEAAMEF